MTVLLDSPAARSLALGRSAATAFRALDWDAAEGVVSSAGGIDVAAERRWKSRSLQASVRLLIFSDGDPQRELLFAAAPVAASRLASYSLGDDILSQRETIRKTLVPHADAGAALAILHAAAYPRERSAVHNAHVPPPPARAHASGFRQLGGTNGFEQIANAAFGALDTVRDELLRFDLEVVLDDLSLLDHAAERTAHAGRMLADRSASCDLLHAIVVTEAPLSLLANAERLAPAPWLRLERTTLIGGERRWIDVVQSEALAAYTTAVASHYAAQFKRRRFTAA